MVQANGPAAPLTEVSSQVKVQHQISTSGTTKRTSQVEKRPYTSALYNRANFIKKVNATDTIVDTLFIIGASPTDQTALGDLAIKGDEEALSDKAMFESFVPEVLSQYPDFNREVIDTDEAQRWFAVNNAFPDGFKSMVQVSKVRPEAHHSAAYSHGGAQSTIYAMLYTFYEDVYSYGLARLEHEKVLTQYRIETISARIKNKTDNDIGSSSLKSSNGNEFGKSATTAETKSIPAEF